MNITKEEWDRRFITVAQFLSHWSKDPSTQCGAVIVKGKNKIMSQGYNGFPAGVRDSDSFYVSREIKLAKIIHAELNAILNAKQDLTGCTIYVYPMPPCSHCAAALIQVGIKRVVSMKPSKEQLSRWQKSFDIADEMYAQAGVELELL